MRVRWRFTVVGLMRGCGRRRSDDRDVANVGHVVDHRCIANPVVVALDTHARGNHWRRSDDHSRRCADWRRDDQAVTRARRRWHERTRRSDGTRSFVHADRHCGKRYCKAGSRCHKLAMGGDSNSLRRRRRGHRGFRSKEVASRSPAGGVWPTGRAPKPIGPATPSNHRSSDSPGQAAEGAALPASAAAPSRSRSVLARRRADPRIRSPRPGPAAHSCRHRKARSGRYMQVRARAQCLAPVRMRVRAPTHMQERAQGHRQAWAQVQAHRLAQAPERWRRVAARWRYWHCRPQRASPCCMRTKTLPQEMQPGLFFSWIGRFFMEVV